MYFPRVLFASFALVLGMLGIFALQPLVPAQSQQSRVDELESVLEVFSGTDRERLGILLQLAESYLYVTPIDSVHIAQDAAGLAARLDDTESEARALLTLGRAQQFLGNFSSDLAPFSRAYTKAMLVNNESLIAAVLRNMGTHYYGIGQFNESLAHLLEALSFAERGPEAVVLGNTYFSLGTLYLDILNYQAAEQSFEKALAIFEDIGDSQGVFVILASFGNLHQRLGNYELAREYYLRVIDLAAETGDLLNLADTHLNVARVEKALGDQGAALSHLDTAFAMSQSISSTELQVDILIERALYHADNTRFDQAVAQLMEALEVSRTSQARESELRIEYELSNMFEKSGNLAAALAHLRQYNVIRAELYPENYAESLATAQANAESERREREIQELRAAKFETDLAMEQETARLNLAVAAFMLVVMVVAFILLRYKSRVQSAKQMEVHNSQLLEVGKQLERADAIKSDFLANTSHEIRTPLNGILGMVTLLSRSELSAEQKEQLRAIEMSGKKLLELVNDLLDLTRIEAGKVEINYLPMNIQESLETEASIWEELARAKDIEFSLDFADDIPYSVVGAAPRIIQVLNNLVSNAVKFTNEGGVKVRIFVEQDYGKEVLVRFEIRDSGIGIAKDKQALLFERFSQIDAGLSRSYQGTGLGLAISKDLVRIMNGEIGVESNEGEGSTFWFRLPMQINSREMKEQDRVRSGRENGVTMSRQLRVLVAEDNAVNQAVISGMLEHMGHTTRFANNGEEAISHVLENPPDVVFMDIQMPVMDGETAAMRLRDLGGEIAKIPIVAVTANAMAGDQERYLEIGMDAYLAKPINMGELGMVLEKIETILTSQSAD